MGTLLFAPRHITVRARGCSGALVGGGAAGSKNSG